MERRCPIRTPPNCVNGWLRSPQSLPGPGATRRGTAPQRAALRKLLILDGGEMLGDLAVPPGNHLEKLRGDRAGQYGIRITQTVANLLSLERSRT